MLWSARGPIFPFAYVSKNRMDVSMCFPYLGLWETGLQLGFGSKHIHSSHSTEEFGFGLYFFLLVNDKSLG